MPVSIVTARTPLLRELSHFRRGSLLRFIMRHGFAPLRLAWRVQLLSAGIHGAVSADPWSATCGGSTRGSDHPKPLRLSGRNYDPPGEYWFRLKEHESG